MCTDHFLSTENQPIGQKFQISSTGGDAAHSSIQTTALGAYVPGTTGVYVVCVVFLSMLVVF